ncbi:MAG TPA: ATP-binding cassette domain-containing protein [Candidatus Pullichristensenella excrementigallinarum]|uniref:ATP-binding cassette domain-containing protein n=1 Tax=Candidatus Pullichristensenella excrementigallinarum TaxID=2840907 RepID=A0A9D1ICF5_9FIRM|nr:ATP-binding cassette domain-containing protein [Candidatus Pullichristensenella excrementigallinarum]
MSELLRVEGLKKYFKTTDGYLHAVDDVSFSIRAGETLGVVGESGCGKSTLGRVVLHLLDATEGKIFYDGEDITSVSSAQLKELRKQMQIIFQDPFSSLNPRMTVEEIIEEPLRIYNLYRESDERNRHVEKLMDVVGLAKRLRRSYPHELDGGRRQRIGIARALALRPRFIVCDEPVSALDVSIQAQILNLLQDLQEEMQLTYLFITHDLSVVKHFSNRICVMYLGKVMEIGDVDELFENTLHPYTQALLSAIPIPDPDAPRNRILLRGEITSPINPKPGCRFAQRCNYATAACSEKDPELRQVADNHWVACVRAGR